MIVSRGKLIGAIAALFALVAMVFPQWNKRTPDQWNKYDIEQMLSDSPWSHEEVKSDTTVLFNRARNRGVTPGDPNAVHVKIRVSFFSSKPVRLALARKIELAKDGKIDEQFAQQLKTFKEGEFYKYIVVTLDIDTTEPGSNVQEALGLLYNLNTSVLKNNTFLEIKGGKKVYLDEYQPPNSDGFGAKLVFPRLVDDEPFIGPASEEVRVYSELSGTYTINQRFRIKDMYFDGKLEY